MPKPTITFLTGLPGTGKSTAAREIEKALLARGKTVHFINDYPLLIQWAESNRGDETKVVWTKQGERENFNIAPSAYQELSLALAAGIAKEIKDNILTTHETEVPDVIIIETARGAGEPGRVDRYDEHLFEPIRDELGKSVHYANLEMVVPNPELVMNRMDERLREQPDAAPSFVLAKYMVDGVQSSSQQADELSRRGEFELIANVSINNSGELAKTVAQFETMVHALLEILGESEDQEHLREIRNPQERK